MSLGVAIPFWLDRPDEEAVEIARTADRAGIQSVWVGEMASFDAFALATAIGLQTERARLKVGPLAKAAKVRSADWRKSSLLVICARRKRLRTVTELPEGSAPS